MSDPNLANIKPQDLIPFIRNDDSGHEDELWRCQRLTPSARSNNQTHFQMGSKDPVGVTSDSPEYTVAVEQNLHDMVSELIMAGKDPTSATSYNLGNVLDQDALRINLLRRHPEGGLPDELEFDDGMVATMTWTFAVSAPSTLAVDIRASLGKLYYSNGSLPHSTYPSDDTTSPGAVLGKDCRVRFGTDSADYRAYRLQRMTIRAAIPVDVVRELGRRALVGEMNRMPTVTVDIDVLAADEQPTDVFFASVAGATPYYDLSDPNKDVDMFVRMYDPDLTEADTVLRAWKLENANVGDFTEMDISLNGQPAKRYSFNLGKPDTAGSCGLICYSGDIT